MANDVIFSGPVASTSAGDLPFRGAPSPVGLIEPDLDETLAANDFVEEEFLVSGLVDGQPYVTSLLVRRPADIAAFSGLVAIEPVHMQGALGFWQTSHPAIMAAGHAWAAIGSQGGAVEGPIRLSNPARYAALKLPAGTADAASKATAALDAWSQGESTDFPPDMFANDAVSNAIMAQLGEALKSGAPGSPFGPAQVTCLILGGASQTGVATLNFIANAHGGARMPDGRPVFDGFLPMAASGWMPISGCDVPVIQIFAEGDLTLFGSIGPAGYMAARPDSDAAGDRFRSYQIAGATHLPTRGLAHVRGLAHLGIDLEPAERFSQFPVAPFYQAAFVNLVRWVRDGIAPPRSGPIEIEGAGIARDVHGNAKGGLRSPWVDFPCARHVTARYLRNLIGVELPFAPHRLFDLHASIGGYLERFSGGIDALVAGRWLLPGDGETLKAEEAAQIQF